MADAEKCPECGEPAVARCGCPIRERVCANRHYWHTCPVHGTIVNDIGDHKNPCACTCGRGDNDE